MKFEYEYRGQIHRLELIPAPGGYAVSLNGRLLDSSLSPDATVSAMRQGRQVWVHAGGRTFVLRRVLGGRSGLAAAGEQSLRAPMPGQVRSVAVRAGQAVQAGQMLLTLEAMKMEIRIQAPRPGKVARLAVAEGDSVEREQLLVELEQETE
ncbi:MAG: biotin/lipoyl-binding protein [Anaerolineales bacterium]|nr:biotin/lipoyl-binding protein [Anaerolineales bacterium]MCW5855438.1 biotin/lipoyl-binding protein [Anaerolineales bacterium]